MNRIYISLLALTLAGCTWESAQVNDTPKAPPTANVLNATNKADIDSAIPTVTVAGIVESTDFGSDGLTIHFKDTQESHFRAMVPSASVNEVNSKFDGDVAKAIAGKPIHVKGQITLTGGNPVIVLTSADQVSIDQGQ